MMLFAGDVWGLGFGIWGLGFEVWGLLLHEMKRVAAAVAAGALRLISTILMVRAIL